MSIHFDKEKNRFTLTTDNTQYVFKVVGGKYLIHCYYGYKSDSIDLSYDVQALSFSSDIRGTEIERFSINDAPLEFAYYGTGDYRCSSLKIKGKHGDSATFFRYCDHEIFRGRKNIEGIPSARATEDTETLAVHLVDDVTKCLLTLYYMVYRTRRADTETVKGFGSDTPKGKG